MPRNEPNWILLKECGEELTREGKVPFRRKQLIDCVQEKHPDRGKNSLNPMIQGMTVNLKGGAPGGIGKNVFYSVGHGLFELYDPKKHGRISDQNAASDKNKSSFKKREIAEFDFEFVRDKEIKKLLIRDWEEAQIAFKNGLYKATVVLCGTVLEALLVDALSCIKEEVKSSYYQQYLIGKNKGNKPLKIENWRLYQLIEIAKQQGVISSNVAKFSHIVRDYRNLIHLWAQKREQLQVDSHIASAVVNLLTLAYNDIMKWHSKRKNG